MGSYIEANRAILFQCANFDRCIINLHGIEYSKIVEVVVSALRILLERMSGFLLRDE